MRVPWLAATALAIGACEAGEPAAPAQSNQASAVVREPESAPPAENAAAPAAAEVDAHPCRIQDGTPVPANRIRAIGTEPFWGARIDGRCVTYSTPEDQAGTRIWTKFSGTAEQGVWAGALDGRRFELRTSLDPRCSDGMSDNIYPIAVSLFVRGEQRRGCAEPLAAGKRP